MQYVILIRDNSLNMGGGAGHFFQISGEKFADPPSRSGEKIDDPPSKVEKKSMTPPFATHCQEIF